MEKTFKRGYSMATSEMPRIKVISLKAVDTKTTVHFYRDVIGLELVPHHAKHPTFHLGNGIFLVIVHQPKKLHSERLEDAFPLIAFAVDDLDIAVDRLLAHGIKLPWGVEESSESRWVKFHDPGGNLIELAQFTGPLDE
jgi:catechol-2,3-dioxygenase